MELQQLKEQLIKQLQQKSNATIVHTNDWCIPISLLKLSYKPILKTKMDILMKMILLSIQRAKFKHAQAISEILLVEELFVQDLMTKMTKTGLIEKVEDYFQLSDKGKQQLSTGVFEEEQPVKTKEVLYSPVHQSVLYGDIEEVLDFVDFPDKIYRYSLETDDIQINDEVLLEHLRSNSFDDDEEMEDRERAEDTQTHIMSIDSTEQLQINDVPCIELIVYEAAQDNIYSKVWNTLLDQWDDTLEKELNGKEESLWRKTYSK